MSFEAIAFPKSENIQVRELDPSETQKIISLQHEMGWDIPLPHLSAVSVAEVDGEIVGFITAQLIPHAEPLWVKQEYRARGVAEMLIQHMKSKVGDTPFMCVANHPFIEKLCRAAGMKEVPGKIFARW